MSESRARTGKCRKCGQLVRKLSAVPPHLGDIARCPCGGLAVVSVIRRPFKPGQKPHKCNAACRGARGNSCLCECGGHMHGIDVSNIAVEASK